MHYERTTSSDVHESVAKRLYSPMREQRANIHELLVHRRRETFGELTSDVHESVAKRLRCSKGYSAV